MKLSLLPLLLWAAFDAPRQAVSDGPPPPRQATAVSAEFRAELEAAMATVPASVWRELRAQGWRLDVAEFVTDAAPRLRGQHPRGWPEGATWEHVDAAQLPDDRQLVFAEKRRTTRGGVSKNTRVAGVLRHEVGHAHDAPRGLAGPRRSASLEFWRAYEHDVRRVSAADRHALRYYLQPGGDGREETFAEAFAIVHGGGSAPLVEEEFRRAFPSVLKQAADPPR